MRFLRLLLLPAFLLTACGTSQRPAKKTEESTLTGPKNTLIGIVEMVNPEQKYVLIRCEQQPKLNPGADLIALDATGTEAKLKLTPERKGLYLTADIVEGHPRVMNLVLQRTGGTSAPAQAPAPATTPTAPELQPIPLIPETDPHALLQPVLPDQPPMQPINPTSSVPSTPEPTLDLEPPVQ